MISLRRADPEDFSAVSTFARASWLGAFGSSVTEADVRLHLDGELSDASIQAWLDSDRVWLAVEARRLLGYSHFGPAPLDDAMPGDQALNRLYVARDRQSEGIGADLLAAGLSEQADSAATWLEVWTENPEAIRFYQRHGFEPVREQPFVSHTGIEGTPDLIMRRPPGTAVQAGVQRRSRPSQAEQSRQGS